MYTYAPEGTQKYSIVILPKCHNYFSFVCSNICCILLERQV